MVRSTSAVVMLWYMTRRTQSPPEGMACPPDGRRRLAMVVDTLTTATRGASYTNPRVLSHVISEDAWC